MAINLVTFAAQTVTPQDDALIYESALTGSGMIYGGTVTIKSANVLRVAEGHGALCGRKFTIEAMDVPIALTPSGSLLGRIYIHMDLADTDEPISIRVETASSLTPVIQDTDVNINNGVYEINLATFEVDTSTISNLVNVAPFLSSVSSEIQTLTNNDDAIVNILGAKNLLPNYAATQTINNVTFTVNSDGSVTVNGRANAATDFPLSPVFLAFKQIKNGDILSGCPNGGSEETYCLICGGSTRYATDTGNGATLSNIDLSYGYKVAIRIRSDVEVTNLVFKPMIRPASITDGTYVPYAKTNRELTTDGLGVKRAVASRSSHVMSTYNFWAFGRMRALQIGLTDATSGETLITLSVEDRPSENVVIPCLIATSSGQSTILLTINTNGTITTNGAAFRGTPTLIWSV